MKDTSLNVAKVETIRCAAYVAKILWRYDEEERLKFADYYAKTFRDSLKKLAVE